MKTDRGIKSVKKKYSRKNLITSSAAISLAFTPLSFFFFWASICYLQVIEHDRSHRRAAGQRAFESRLWKILMRRLTLGANVSHPLRRLSIRASITSWLTCHTIPGRKATIKALRLSLSVCHLFSAFADNAVTPFERDSPIVTRHACDGRKRARRGDTFVGNDGRGDEREGRKKQ